MALKRMALELGMGTDIQGGDYTKAATRAVQNALRQNALVVADAFDMPRDAMQVTIHIGVQKPDQVDTKAIASLLPYGSATVNVETGGMDTANEAGTNTTIMANAALVVYLDLPDDKTYGVPA